MSSRKVFPGDTQWAIAGKIPAPTLAKIGRRLPEWLHGDGHRVVTGNDGFAALLVFGGPADLGERPAAELAKRGGPVYLLDFDDEAYSTKELTGSKVKRLRGYPNELLEKHGIIAPGWEPSPPSPVIVAGVVEGVTAEEARRLCTDFEADLELAEHPRGVLMTGYAACRGRQADEPMQGPFIHGFLRSQRPRFRLCCHRTGQRQRMVHDRRAESGPRADRLGPRRDHDGRRPPRAGHPARAVPMTSSTGLRHPPARTYPDVCARFAAMREQPPERRGARVPASRPNSPTIRAACW